MKAKRTPERLPWVVLLAQLPASPSSARVSLWRQLRAAGAMSLMNGAWVLPAKEAHRQLFAQLAKAIRSQGGHASILSHAEIEDGTLTIKDRFARDRAREYEEFQSRSSAFFAEIAKERKLKKFTFAELEEIDDDFVKLNAWLDKIVARDFFPNQYQRNAILTLKRCDVQRKAFARSVYAAEGLEQDDQKDE